MAKEEILNSLDIGTTKVCLIVSRIDEDGGIEVLGYGSVPAAGALRKGVIINLDRAVGAIEEAVEQAEQMSGLKVKNVVTSVGGIYLKGTNSNGNRTISRGNKEITRGDIRAVIEASCELSIPLDQEIIFIYPQEYIVDGQDGIKDPPCGLTGENLGVKVHLFMGAITSLQNVIKSINLSGIRVINTIPAPLAAALAVLAEDEIENGVALVDLGGGTTTVSVFLKGAIIHTCVLGLGGEQITGDISVGVRSSYEVAERLKKEYSYLTLQAEEGDIEVPGLGGRGSHIVSKLTMREIIQARIEEILEFVKAEIRKTGYQDLLSAGVVITGGVSNTKGILEFAEDVLKMPVRLGLPGGIVLRGEVSALSDPAYAVAIGLLSHSKLKGYSTFARGSFGERLKRWFQNFF